MYFTRDLFSISSKVLLRVSSKIVEDKMIFKGVRSLLEAVKKARL